MERQVQVPHLQDLPDLLTVDEVARVLRIGRGKAYLLVRAGELPSIKLGHALRIPKIAVARLLERRAQGGIDE